MNASSGPNTRNLTLQYLFSYPRLNLKSLHESSLHSLITKTNMSVSPEVLTGQQIVIFILLRSTVSIIIPGVNYLILAKRGLITVAVHLVTTFMFTEDLVTEINWLQLKYLIFQKNYKASAKDGIM